MGHDDLYAGVSGSPVSAPEQGVEACFGGDSDAHASGPDEGLTIAFHDPDPSVSIVPRSGIPDSQTVLRAGASLAAAVLAAPGGRAQAGRG